MSYANTSPVPIEPFGQGQVGNEEVFLGPFPTGIALRDPLASGFASRFLSCTHLRKEGRA